MTIATRAQLAAAFTWRLQYMKSSIGSQTTGSFSSCWRASAASAPAQGATPGAAAICSSATTGAMPFDNPPSGARTYIAAANMATSNGGSDHYVHDRLGHMGGLDGTNTGAQTVSLDASVSTSNLANRRGATDYSDVLWWLEWYTATGSSAVTATVAVTYDNGSTDTIAVSVPASTAASRLIPIYANTAGRYIKSVQTVTLSGTTGTVGSFGVTATRMLTCISGGAFANFPNEDGWARTGLPRVHDDACLFFIVLPSNVATGTLTGFVRLAQG